MRIPSLSGPKKLALSILAAAATAAGVAGAVPLPPGTAAPTVGFSIATDPTLAGTIIASQTLPFSCSGGGAFLSGTLDNYVVKNTLGTLDFYYHVTSSSASNDRIVLVRSADYTPAAVDADYRTDLAGMIAPPKVDRDPSGALVEWIFPAISPTWDSKHFYARSGLTAFAPTGKTEVVGGSGLACGIGGTYMPL